MTQMPTELAYAHIVRTPGVCGGRVRIDGHRIRVQDIAIESEWQAMSPEEICHVHPGLTLAEVYSALAYFHDHRTEILEEIEADRAAVEEFRRRFPDQVR
jgi:uncharacterized protein (DUF433 family)